MILLSMDEKKTGKKRIILIILAVLLVAGGLGGYFFYRAKQTEEQSKKTATETVTIEKKTIVSSVSGTGTVSANQTQDVVTDLAGYKVLSVDVAVGDMVSPGDVICVLDVSDVSEQRSDIAKDRSETIADMEEQDADYQEQLTNNKKDRKERLAEARERFTTAKKEYKDAKTDYENYKAEYDLEVERSNNAKLQASLWAASASLAAAQNQNTTTTTTVTMGSGSLTSTYQVPVVSVPASGYTIDSSVKNDVELASMQTTLEQKRLTMNSAETTMNSAEAQVKAIKAENDDAIEDAKENYDDTQSDLIEQYDDTISDLDETIGKAVVYADLAGAVTELNVEAGRTLNSSVVAKIEGMGDYYVTASVDEYDVADVKVGMSVVMKTDATRDEELHGVVTYVAVKASEATGAGSAISDLSGLAGSDLSAFTGGGSGNDATYEVHIALDAQNERLRLGMNVQVSIITEEADEVLSVPYEAIRTRDDGSRYIVVSTAETNAEGTVYTDENTKEINVEVGLEGSYYSQILSDEIKEGMTVILPEDTSTNSVDELLDMVGNAGGV